MNIVKALAIYMCFLNGQMDLKMEMFVSTIIIIIIMSMNLDVCMDILRCFCQGAGNQLLIAQGAGHYKIQMLCVESLGIKVSCL